MRSRTKLCTELCHLEAYFSESKFSNQIAALGQLRNFTNDCIVDAIGGTRRDHRFHVIAASGRQVGDIPYANSHVKDWPEAATDPTGRLGSSRSSRKRGEVLCSPLL